MEKASHKTMRKPKSAEQGYADAQFNLGGMYAEGKGTPQDDKQAVHWYTKSAEQGLAAAQNNLGVMYLNGKAFRKMIKGHWSPNLQSKVFRWRRIVLV